MVIKRFIYSIFATGAIFSMASCSSDEPVPGPADGGITFSVQLPRDMQTRGTFGDQERATLNNLQWTVFEVGADGTTLTKVLEGNKDNAFANSQMLENVTLPLLNGHQYQVAFYADNKYNMFVTFSDGKVNVDYSNGATNNKEEDAFIGKSKVFTVNGGYSETVTLTRPFAQLNWGTDDITNPLVQNLLNTAEGVKATVTVSSGLYNTMDVISGDVSGEVSSAVTFPAVQVTNPGAATFPVAGYELVAMNYLLTGNGTIDCQLAFNQNLKPVTVNAASVKVNYRTNIYGSLLTAPANFNIVVDPSWNNPDIENTVEITSPADFYAALANPAITDINVDQDLDLSQATTEQLTFHSPKTITVATGKTIQMGATNVMVANNGLTLTGGGTITNANTDNPGTGYSKNLIFVKGGALNISNMTLVNDPDYHNHGDAAQGRPYNNAAISYWPGTTEVNLDNVNITSGGFTLCGMVRGGVNTAVLNLTNSKFTSNSSNKHGNFAYAMRLHGSTGTMENCTVNGVQGGLSTDDKITLTIKSGTYATHNTSASDKDAFYAVYATAGSTVIIEGGEFSSPNVLTSLPIDGTSCVVSGDNDVSLTDGNIILKGGKFSGKPYDHVTNKVYNPASGYVYSALQNQDPYKWEVIPATSNP